MTPSLPLSHTVAVAVLLSSPSSLTGNKERFSPPGNRNLGPQNHLIDLGWCLIRKQITSGHPRCWRGSHPTETTWAMRGAVTSSKEIQRTVFTSKKVGGGKWMRGRQQMSSRPFSHLSSPHVSTSNVHCQWLMLRLLTFWQEVGLILSTTLTGNVYVYTFLSFSYLNIFIGFPIAHEEMIYNISIQWSTTLVFHAVLKSWNTCISVGVILLLFQKPTSFMSWDIPETCFIKILNQI